VTDEEISSAIEHDPTTAHETGGPDIDAAKNAKHGKKGSKILGFFKGTTKGAVKTAIAEDTVRAKMGSRHAKNRLGVVEPKGASLTSGPVEFKGRHEGSKGHVYITTSATIHCVAFSTDSTIDKTGTANRQDLHPLWTVAVSDIVELKKFGGYGWKSKLVVGWSLERGVSDGLEIVTKTGETYKITALPLRDELFNRLVAMGGQKWECW
jgi:hypothetical protein